MTNDELWKKYLNQIKRINKFIDTQTKLGFKFPESIVPETPKKITEKSVERLQKMTPTKMFEQATYKVPETGEIVSGVVGKNMIKFRQANSKDNLVDKRKKYYEKNTKRMGTKKTGAPPDKTTAVINNATSLVSGGNSTLADIQKMIEEWTPLATWSTPKNNGKWLSLEECKRNDKNTLARMLAGAIFTQGEEAVAQRLEAVSQRAIALAEDILYGSGSKEGNFKDGRTYVNDCLVEFSTIIMGRPMTAEERMDLEEEAESTEVYN